MAPRRIVTLTLLLVGLPVLAQPVPETPKGKEPKQIRGGSEGKFDRMLEMMPPGPGQEAVDDFRMYLEGKVPKPKDIDPNKLKDLLDKVSKLPKDQQTDRKSLERMLRDNPQFMDPEFLKQLKSLANSDDFKQKLDSKFPPTEERPPIVNEPDLQDKMKQVVAEGQKPFVPEVGGPKGPMNPENLQPPETPEPAGDPTENPWVKWLDKNFGDSPAAQNAMKDLISNLNGTNGGKGLFDKMPDFKGGDVFKGLGNIKGPNGGSDFKFNPPDLKGTGMSGPKFGSGGGSFGGGGFGGGAPSVGGAAAGGGTALAVIVGIAGGIVLLIVLLRKWQLKREAQATLAQAGRAGYDFSGVRTREQLVTAFDTVSIDRIGDEARAWNHRVIADQFGVVQPGNLEPANELGGLYEQARYAPPDEDLQPVEYAAARKDLGALAGVPG